MLVIKKSYSKSCLMFQISIQYLIFLHKNYLTLQKNHLKKYVNRKNNWYAYNTLFTTFRQSREMVHTSTWFQIKDETRVPTEETKFFSVIIFLKRSLLYGNKKEISSKTQWIALAIIWLKNKEKCHIIG